MKVKLIHRTIEVPGVESLTFQPEEKITWKAGQFAHYVFHHEPTDERGSDRWFTISAAPFEKVLRITTRFNPGKSSTFKTGLKNLQIGKSVEISYIEGDFIIDDLTKKYVFIAGGIGITPIRSILKQLDYENKKINATLLYANRDKNIVFKKELEEFAAKNPGLKIHYIISPQHVDQKTIHKLIPALSDKTFYVSGPEPMVENLGNLLKSMDIAADNLVQDWFPNYPIE